MATIGETTAMIGHDIRNPLQSIVGNIFLAKSDVSLLPENEITHSLKESLDAIDLDIDYINKIVLDLQNFAKPLNPIPKETNIETLIKYEFNKKTIPDNIKTSYYMADDARIIVTDNDFLKRILDNLVLNAVQAMPDGGELLITATKKLGKMIISVQDNGNGIPEEIKPKLFTPMVTTKSKGQGFGLAVVKRMTEALDGKISFESEMGKGTKFIITLPVRR